ncbi:hypothetical protein BMS3Bbin08_00035 [bacterium BMS3Bbin08]|nr:hypothetical protein BMS3Bbin08_00035 [bacterium BMS3Bbin08]HDL01999.1 hypothetical protein [candidate division Zixibacteria bacterium]
MTEKKQSKQPLEKKIQTWLKTQGYPLEMRVARAFQDCGFSVISSDYYSDPNTQELREIDVVGYLLEIVNNVRVRITLTVECKSSTGKPWVMFCPAGTRLKDSQRVTERVTSKVATKILPAISTHKEVYSLPLFKLSTPSGHSITQAFTSGSDVGFKALTSACNAALAMTVRADKFTRDVSIRICEIVFPVVVIEGQLFRAQLKDGDLHVQEVLHSTLLWRNPIIIKPGRMVHAIVHILTQDGLTQFAKDAAYSAARLIKFVKEKNLFT